MTEQEKQEIISEIKKYFREQGMTANAYNCLDDVRSKWFRERRRGDEDSPFEKAFDSTNAALRVWENIRRLTCIMCGKTHVTELRNDPYAEEICEKLCQFVYDLKMEYKGQDLEG